MRGIILKDLYEGFCIKKNLINWLVSMIFTSALTATVEVEILAGGREIVGRAAVPSGASTGKFEAVGLS